MQDSSPQTDLISDLYGPDYYKQGCGPIPYERNSHWLNFFGGIADEIVRALHPVRVFDAGCALGFLVESLCDRGVEARGVDISQFAIANVRPDMRRHCSTASLVEPIPGGPYDLVTCIEVLEHMPEAEAREAMQQMTTASDMILFSSTPDDFNEPTHVNVHPVIYWLKLLGEFRFYPVIDFDASFLASHAFLARKTAPVRDDVLVLFSETLRLRSQRAAFLTRHGRIEQLQQEVESLTRQGKEAAIEAAAGLQQQAEQWDTLKEELAVARFRLSLLENVEERAAVSLEAANEKLAAQIRETALWAEQARQGETTRTESVKAITSFQYRLQESKTQIVRAESMVEEWMAHCTDLSHNLETLAHRYEALQVEKESLLSSPGWRLILRYREWLRSSRLRHSWIGKYWEPAFLWALRRAKLGGGRGATFVPSPARVLPPSERIPAREVPLNTPNGEPDRRRQEHPPTVAKVASVAETGPNQYETWIRENEPDGVQLEIQRRMSDCFTYRPKISVLVPVYRVPEAVLRDTIESVLAQTYSNWELCVTVPGEDNNEARTYLEDAASRESRIRLKVLDTNEGISGNSNQALALASGEFLALLDHDDTLAPFALFEVVQLLNQNTSVNFIYSDKDQISEDGRQRFLPLFKPEWSPEILLNANYLTHLCVMRSGQVREIGGWRKETDGAQDWDLFLRIIQRFGNVRHIPKVLYHWRQISTSVASGGLQAKPYAALGQVNCVKDHCKALGLKDVTVVHNDGELRILWPVRAEDRVSVVYLSSAPTGETLVRAEKLAQETKYPNFEILVPTSEQGIAAAPLKCVSVPTEATLLDRIEAATKSASGGTLVFLDEGVNPLSADWLAELVGPLELSGVGIVGAKLLDPITRTLRHCGIVFTVDGRPEYIYAGQPEHVSEQAGTASWYRDWTAVSGACFAIRRDVWDRIEGMSGNALHARLDIHLNLKLLQHPDLRILYNPYVRMLQGQESALETFVRRDVNADAVRALLPKGDPYFNPNLNCRNGKLSYSLRTSQPLEGPNYSAESQVLVQIFDFVPEQVARSKRLHAKRGSGRLESITWFLPEFGNAFYGGIHTILRFADAFRRSHNVRAHFCTLGRVPGRRVRTQVAAAFPELAAASSFFCVDAQSKVNQIPATDAAVCSLWTTAYAALEFENARRKFYFIQDDEALFYPAGSISALVEATYRFGFYGVCNTVSLLKSYNARGGEGEFFSPCIDNNIFHDRNRASGFPHTLFCYGRPGHPRNSFELLSTSLRILKQRMGDSLLAISAGAEWDPRSYGLDGVVYNLGVLNYNSTGALYRMCEAGVAIMMTRHPSYLPLELMGCGSLVVTNRNPDTSWLLKDGENCLLADLSPTSFADRIQEGLENVSLRARITADAGKFVQASYSRWEDQTEKVYQYMLKLC